MRYISIFLIMCMCVLGTGCGSGDNADEEIKYSGDLKMYAYHAIESSPTLPNGKRGVVLLVHGGGWSTGAPSKTSTFAGLINTSGLVAFTVQYRLSTEAVWPAQRDDVTLAVEWVIQNADKYNIDTSEITLIGESAGGHISLMVAEAGANVKSVISKAGPSGIPEWYLDVGFAFDWVNGLLGTENPTQEQLENISPLHNINPLLSVKILQQQGGKDIVNPNRYSVNYADGLSAAGRFNEYMYYPTLGHALLESEDISPRQDAIDWIKNN